MRVSNTGTELHEAILFKLNEGDTIEDFMALLGVEIPGESTPEAGTTPEVSTTPEGNVTPESNTTPEAGATPESEATTEGSGEPGVFAGNVLISPGIVTYTKIDFAPGTYAVVCFIPSPENSM